MIIFRCDRCGKVYEKATGDRTLYIGKEDADGYNAHTLDLCDECYESLHWWMNMTATNCDNEVADHEDHWREVTDKTERNGG